MILYYGNNFKSGLKIIFEKKPYSIENSEFVKPGKGKTFVRIKMRNLLNNQLIEKTFRSTDHLIGADIKDIKLIYIYNDKKYWYFMNKKDFNQISLSLNIIKEKYKWLIEQKEYVITLWNQNPIAITITNFVNLKVIQDTIKTKSYSILNTSIKYKLCRLNTGAIVKIPIFIKKGDIIKIDTRTGKYHSRVNRLKIL